MEQRETAASRRSDGCKHSQLGSQGLCRDLDQGKAIWLLLCMNISGKELATGSVDAYEIGRLSVPKRQRLCYSKQTASLHVDPGFTGRSGGEIETTAWIIVSLCDEMPQCFCFLCTNWTSVAMQSIAVSVSDCSIDNRHEVTVHVFPK